MLKFAINIILKALLHVGKEQWRYALGVVINLAAQKIEDSERIASFYARLKTQYHSLPNWAIEGLRILAVRYAKTQNLIAR